MLGFLRRRRKKPEPAALPTPAQALRAEFLGALARLRSRNPELADRLVLRKFGLDPGSEDPITELIQTLKLLRQAGLIDDPRRAGADDWLQDALRAVGQGLALGLAGGLGKPAVIAPPPQSSPASPPAVVPTPGPDGKLSIVSSWVIQQLDGLTPEEAAEWLLSQPAPQAQELARLIAGTPPEQLGQVLADLKHKVPDLAGAVDWLLARPDWLLRAASALRVKLAFTGGLS